MQITMNGEPREVQDGATVRQILDAEREPAGHVLVEVNGAYVPHPRYDAWVLREGDRLEIILPAFGG